MSIIDISDGSGFGLANLPYGVFSPPGGAPRVGVRVGDSVVDLALLFDEDVFARPSLNAFLAQGRQCWTRVREAVAERVAGEVPDAAVYPVDAVRPHLPFDVADYVDFYASEHHARNLGRIFRPDEAALTPNWKHLPVGYHGRAGTVVVSGTDVVRPRGQRVLAGERHPSFGASLRLDVEAELGFVVGVGSGLGAGVACADFAEHVFGVVLVNDWSARDIQAWEYVPLGPFLGKSFATSISPWVVPLAALEVARVTTPPQDPPPLPYLRDDQGWGLDVDLAIEWNGRTVSWPRYRDMYWSPAQMLAHLTVNGASCRTGDLFASGTVSGPGAHQRGSFVELTRNGADPVEVAGGPRTFVLDGDEVVVSATAPATDGGRLSFGEVRGRVVPAREPPE